MKLPMLSAPVRLWLVGVFALLALLLWGGLQDEDPLSPYIADDAVRHILGFAALGFIAAFVRQTVLRSGAMAFVFAFALLFEVLQGPFSPRQASWEDFFASSLGALAGYGLGTLLLTSLQAAAVLWERLGPGARRAD